MGMDIAIPCMVLVTLALPAGCIKPVATNPASASIGFAASGGGGGYDLAKKILVDKNGIVIAGLFEKTARFGELSITAKGNSDVFIAWLGKSGNYVSVKTIGGKGRDYLGDIDIDAEGNTIIVGQCAGRCGNDNQEIAEAPFIYAITPSGRIAALEPPTSTSHLEITNVVANNDGTYIVAGVFNGVAQFGKTVLVSKGTRDGYIASVDRHGRYRWVTHLPSSGMVWTDALLCGRDGNAYLSGRFFGKLAYGSRSVFAEEKKEQIVVQGVEGASYNKFVFIAKISRKGQFLWLNRPNRSPACDYDVDSDATGNIWFLGSFADGLGKEKSCGNFHLVQIDSRGLIKTHKTVVQRFSNPLIAAGIGGKVYISGRFVRAIDRFDKGKPLRGFSGVYVAVFKDGSFRTQESGLSDRLVMPLDMAVDDSESLYVTGLLLGSGRFNKTMITSRGEADFFIWKLAI